MLAWQTWLIVAGICLVIEILTVGFLIFWLAIAALIVSLLSLFIDNLIIQTSIFIILSTILILCTRPLSKKISKKDNVVTNSNSLIGKKGIVKKEITSDNPGQVKVCSELWTAVLSSNFSISIPEGSSVKIVSISGVKLVVEPEKIASNV